MPILFRRVVTWMGVVLSLFLVGCSSAPKPTGSISQVPVKDPSQIHWDWQPDAVELTLKADTQLNYYNGQSHALMLCIYQLKDKSSFEDLKKTSAGISRLLQCDGYDQNVVYSRRLFVQPGESKTIQFPRYQGVKTVGLVAGYANPMTGKVAKSFDIPIDKQTKGIIWTTDWYKPGKLSMQLILGRQLIETGFEGKGVPAKTNKTTDSKEETKA